MDAFQHWLGQQRTRGFSPASISNLCKAFEQGGAPPEKLAQFGQLVREFCGRSRAHPAAGSSPDPGARLYGSTWYLYLFHPLPPNESVAVYGRAVLRMHEDLTAEIRNIPDGHTPNYRGTWRIFGGDLLLFDFSSAGDRAHLHIKVNYNPDQPEFDIMLGAFISNGRGYLSSGTLVFEKIAPEAAGTAEPQYFTYNRNAAHFHQTQPAIRKYLKSRSLNYLQIPGRVFLKMTLNEARDRIPSPHTRFIEDGQPQVYFAMPTYSVDTQRYEAASAQLQLLREGLDQDFGSQITVHSNAFRTGDALRLEYQQVLSRIRQTTLFCLLYLDKVPSNALIELGMAYAQAKYIRIFTTRNAMLNTGFLSSGAGSHPVSGAAGHQQMPFVQIVEIDREDLEEAFQQIRLHLTMSIRILLHQAP
ncbi:MAG: hypothetical protein NW241_10215 [Bacteroidia bacterium]|nr:hypothetical protein [Bacteroidia bacterium]